MNFKIINIPPTPDNHNWGMQFKSIYGYIPQSGDKYCVITINRGAMIKNHFLYECELDKFNSEYELIDHYATHPWYKLKENSNGII